MEIKSNSMILFYGASKRNPGEVGVGGILDDPKEKNDLSYSQGLGTSSNSQEKYYSLLQGIMLVVEEKFKF
jgi:ribonuclease HI